jgi:hypothetical protein
VNPGADAPQSLESSLLSRLKQSLLQGTTIVQSDEDRHVERSLGCEWVLDWNEGTSQCRAVGEAHIGPWEKAAIGLTRPLQNPTWIRGWIASVDPQLGRQVRERIVKELWTRLQRSPELRTARWQLLAARFRIAQPIRLALRLWADLNPSTDDLFFLRSVRTVVEARGRENPRLLPLLGLVPRDEASVWSGDYRALRDYLTTRGLREAGWKLLCRHGRRLWQGAVGSARHLDDPLVMIIAIANALAIAGERRVPPPDVVHAIVDAEGLIVAGQELKRLVPAKLLAAATRQWRSLQGKPARRAFARTGRRAGDRLVAADRSGRIGRAAAGAVGVVFAPGSRLARGASGSTPCRGSVLGFRTSGCRDRQPSGRAVALGDVSVARGAGDAQLPGRT